jgi:AAA15 family ATPase/GTPase
MIKLVINKPYRSFRNVDQVFSFGGNLNVISGINGSGKSQMLTLFAKTQIPNTSMQNVEPIDATVYIDDVVVVKEHIAL